MMRTIRSALATVESQLDSMRRDAKATLGLTGPPRIVAYRGWGRAGSIWLRGRVLEDQGVGALADRGDLAGKLAAMVLRYESDEIPDVPIRARLADRETTVRSDEEGYFEVSIDDVALDAPWTTATLRVEDGAGAGPRATGWIRVPGAHSPRLVISDIDDTIVETGATNLLRHARTVLLNDARSREPFQGVAPLYRGLTVGASGDEDNPIFYVSSSPWNLYELFDTFLELHDIPRGPILLKDFGLDADKLLKKGHLDYKRARMERVLDAFPEHDAILVGDSGQKDAWVFERLVESRPGRVVAAYLRDLDPDDPDPGIVEIENRLRARGVPMLRVPNMGQVAVDACERGWISAEARDATLVAATATGDA